MSKGEFGSQGEGRSVSRRKVLELGTSAIVAGGAVFTVDRVIGLKGKTDKSPVVQTPPIQNIPEIKPSPKTSPADSLAQSQIGLNNALRDQAEAQKRLLDAQAKELGKPKEGTSVKDLIIPLSSIGVTAGVAIAGGFKYFNTRKYEVSKGVEARFDGLVATIGSDAKPKERASAVIALRTYLQAGKEAFYPQVFDLSVAHLRPDDSEEIRQHDSVNKALVPTFIKAFPLARDSVAPELAKMEEKGFTIDNPYVQEAMKKNDASNIALDKAYCGFADFKGGWLFGASFNETNFFKADLDRTVVVDADFTGAVLKETKLSEAIATGANFANAKLTRTLILRSNFMSANFAEAQLNEVYLLGSDLTGSNIELAADLTRTQISVGSGLTDSQVQQCEAKGATFVVLPEPSIQTKPNKRTPPGVISIIR